MDLPAWDMLSEPEEHAPGALPRALPRGPHSLPRDVVVGSQRLRLLLAMVEVVAEKGYAATTVADIITCAGVSRSTFYEQFRDKEDCFLVAYQRSGDLHFRRVAEAVATADDPVEQLRRNIRAYLEEMAAFPAFARAFMVESMTVGPSALAIRDRLHQRYVGLLGDLYERFRERFRERSSELPPLPLEVFRAAVAAVDDLAVRWIREGQIAELTKLEPLAVYVELALFGLPGAAEPPSPGRRPAATPPSPA